MRAHPHYIGFVKNAVTVAAAKRRHVNLPPSFAQQISEIKLK